MTLEILFVLALFAVFLLIVGYANWNRWRGVEIDNSEAIAARYQISKAPQVTIPNRRWPAMLLQAAFILPWPVMAAMQGHGPGFVATIAAIAALMVWFVGAVLANLADWLRFRLFRRLGLRTFERSGVVGDHAHEASAEDSTLRGKPIFSGKTLENVRRLAVRKKPRNGL